MTITQFQQWLYDQYKHEVLLPINGSTPVSVASENIGRMDAFEDAFEKSKELKEEINVIDSSNSKR